MAQPEASSVSGRIHRPSHYVRWKIEPITFIQANDMPFWMGNVVKYVMRAGYKEGIDELEDLAKAKRYIEMREEHVRRQRTGTELAVEGNPL